MKTTSPEVGPPLDLVFRRSQDQTGLIRRRLVYPYAIQAPLRKSRAQAGCHVILQSASGGLFSGERLAQRIEVEEGADARIELPTATTAHAMPDGQSAYLDVTIRLQAGARLAYLTRPVILFPTSAVEQHYRIQLGEQASLLFRDGFMTHDPWRAGQRFRSFANTLELTDAKGQRLVLDRQIVTGDALASGMPGLVGVYRAFGTLLLASVDALAWETIAADFQSVTAAGLHIAATPLRRATGLLVRVAAVDGGALDAALTNLTAMLEALLREPAAAAQTTGSKMSLPA